MKRVLVVMLTIMLGSISPATVYGAARNCDANAVVYCGATGKSNLVKKLTAGDTKHSGATLRADYRSVDPSLTASSISSATTVSGYVYKDGHITAPYKNGKPSKTNATVATNAHSYGRQNIPGSTKAGDLYKRPTSVSMNSDRLPALVHFKNGRFAWAIILACGNPVVATPVTPKATTVKTAAIPTTTTTNIYNTQIVENPPAQTPPPAPVIVHAATVLPDTGSDPASTILGLGAIAIASGVFIRSRQRRLAITRQRSA